MDASAFQHVHTMYLPLLVFSLLIGIFIVMYSDVVLLWNKTALLGIQQGVTSFPRQETPHSQ